MNLLITRLLGRKSCLLVVATLSLAGYAYGCKNSPENTPENTESSQAAPNMAESGKVKITAGSDGFSPSSVQVKQGQPLTLEFTRVTDKTCATQVAFPELNLTKDLPLNETVNIPVPTDQARKLTFQCGMGMYKSSVVIL